MKLPRKVIIVPDWEALWGVIKVGGVFHVEDMDRDASQAFRMYCRTHQGTNLVMRENLACGFQLSCGGAVGEAKPNQADRWDALIAEILSGGSARLENTVKSRSAFGMYCFKKGHKVSFRKSKDGTCTATFKSLANGANCPNF